ncbi:hypothetical protein WR25_04785 [Diploscapter pachys]|uniref:Cytochrome P450 n=1 Tax=Diploscapter pachys TaxID=2018661 RepID=A0A2A2LH75_9BILA|nr:hypothetical protein WR25_04785 [Diploscapter pachys]
MSIFLSNPLYSILSLFIFITVLFVHSYLKHRSFPAGRLNYIYDREIGLQVTKSSPSNPDKAIVSTVSSIIDSFVFGGLDKCTASWKDNLDAILKNVAAPQTQLINSYPLLRFCPILNRTFTKFVKAGNAINTELGSRVAARRQMSAVSEHDDQLPEDFIQAALKQNKNYSDTTLITSAGDLWTGGLSTTVTLLRWALIYLVHHPNVQTRIREEVLEAFGQSMPNYKEKEKTPYFLATIRELLRLVNVLPYGIPHRASKDVTMVVEGKTYFIPKGATVFPIYGVTNFDPNVFPEPYSFNPDRFLNTSHNDFSNPQNFFPFGAGRRRCAGSSLAYIELYVLLGRIMQFFEIHPEDGKLPSLQRSPGMTNEPLPFKVVLKNVPGPGIQRPV